MKLEAKIIMQKIKETKRWCFKKTKLTNFSCTKTKRGKTYIGKIRNKKKTFSSNTSAVWKNQKEYDEQLNTSKLNNPEEIDDFVDT